MSQPAAEDANLASLTPGCWLQQRVCLLTQYDNACPWQWTPSWCPVSISRTFRHTSQTAGQLKGSIIKPSMQALVITMVLLISKNLIQARSLMRTQHAAAE